MFLSLNWIKEYVKIPTGVTLEQLSHDLTMATVEVENIVDQSKQYENMIVGKIVEVKKHPAADKLQLAMTDIGGGEIKQIVCGGINLFEGMKVAVALPGAFVRWHGEGDLVELKKTKIRGEESFGMICASTEVGLGDLYPEKDEREIMNISHVDVEAGTPLAEGLGLNDALIEIDNKSLTNRPDLWCHYGIARELAAIYNTELNKPKLIKLDKKSEKDFKINISSDDCLRYIGVVVEGIEVGPSPEWMKQRLSSAGIRSINNIVDLTNYVMLDIGEPMHAFDSEKIGNTIVVRFAHANEELNLLGGDNIKLETSHLVIADSKKPIALAGIKGGEDSGVVDGTNLVVFEAAIFDPISIRRTATQLEQRTDASMRHEKGIDTDRALVAMERLLFLLQELQPNIKIKSVVDVNPKPTKQNKIVLTREFIVSRLGQDLSAKVIVDILERLEFVVKVNADELTIDVPTWRSTGDVSIPEDIVEEVARIYGYDNLERFSPVVTLEEAVYQPEFECVREVRNFLAFQAGLHEVYNYPWVQDRIVTSLDLPIDEMVEIAHPPSEQQKFLQTSLIANLIETVEKNVKHSDEFGIFEVARVFQKNKISNFSTDGEQLSYQPKRLAGAVVGGSDEEVYERAKGICEALFNKFRIPLVSGASNDLPEWLDARKSQGFIHNKELYGFVGFLNKNVSKFFGFNKKSVCFFEIYFTEAQDLISFGEKKYKPLPQFPGVTRDIAIEVPLSVKWEDIIELVAGSSDLLVSVYLFDIYKGKHISEGRKSIAFRLEFISEKRTLESEEIDNIVKNIIKKLENKLEATLRT